MFAADFFRKAARSRGWLVFAVLLALISAGAARVETQSVISIIGSSPLPSLSGATGWINSKPLTAKELKGKVVLIDFWDYSCINCIRSIPYIKAWADKYKGSGLVVIGVHTPEFDVEKQPANVQKAVRRFAITYPVALDSDNRIWNAFHNEYWPAEYFIDAKGKVRYEHFGEGDYDQSEQWIRKLLTEAHDGAMAPGVVNVHGTGAEAAADGRDDRSPETDIGYVRAENFASPGGIRRDVDHVYPEPRHLALNQWGLAGSWLERPQKAVLQLPGGKILFRFHARDLHLTLGPAAHGKPVRFHVTVDGLPPGANHGADVDAQGNGVVQDDRLYQMIRQHGSIADHTFAIEFEAAGVQAFSFTFG